MFDFGVEGKLAAEESRVRREVDGGVDEFAEMERSIN